MIIILRIKIWDTIVEQTNMILLKAWKDCGKVITIKYLKNGFICTIIISRNKVQAFSKQKLKPKPY